MIVLKILLFLILLLLTAGYLVFWRVFVRRAKPLELTEVKHISQFLPEIRSGTAWFREQNPERIAIRSRDGLKLVGYFLPAEQARGTVLMVHGYRDSPWNVFGCLYPFYHALGWNILTVWQRANGESEGQYVTFGIRERFDLRDWALYLDDRFGRAHPVVLYGMSLGCASALMALGTNLPANVRGVIADCGFTSPEAQFRYLMKTRYHFPAQPLMWVSERFAKLLAGIRFDAYSTVTALKQSRLPVLFVHGERDTFVSPAFSRENYTACAGEKQLLLIPDAGHGTAFLFGKDACQAAVRDFLDTCLAETE